MVVNIDKFIDETEAATFNGGVPVGTISKSPEVVLPISGTTPASSGVIAGTNIFTQDHPDGSTTGLKFEFQVPDDYDSGSLTLTLVYAMSTGVASPNNVVTLELGAEIAKVSDGTIDTATYPLTPVLLTTPNNTTAVTRSVILLTIAPADFGAGDKILFLVKRLGADAGDLHTGVLQIIDYMVAYEGQIAARSALHDIDAFVDTDEAAPPAGTKSSFDTLDFEAGVDQEQKFQFIIPDNWDGVSDIHIRFTYAMSAAAALVVLLETEGDVANVITGTITPLSVISFAINTTSDTNVHRTTVVRTIAAVGRNRGDVVALKFARRGISITDNHTGNWQLIAAAVDVGVGASVPVSVLSQFYLTSSFINVVSGSVTGVQEGVALGGDFELYTLMSSSSAGARINVEWAGRLATNQTRIVSLAVPIRGSAGSQYQLKVYADTFGATPVYDSGLLPAPVSRTLVTILEGDLSSQPAGEKRYHVVIEATLDNTETLRVGNVFARQE